MKNFSASYPLYGILSLLILTAGCVGSFDPSQIAGLKAILDQYPDAEIKTSFLDASRVEETLTELRKDCESISVKPYYKISIKSDKITGVAYVNSAGVLECSKIATNDPKEDATAENSPSEKPESITIQPEQNADAPASPSTASSPEREKSKEDNEGSPVKGNKNAPITIIEFSDFQCPSCARFFSNTLPEIEKQYVNTGKAKIIYKHLPLDIHPQANPAALASECAHEQGKFWQYHDLIFENQNSLRESSYKAWAEQLNLQQAQFNDCFDNKKHQDKITRDKQQGQKEGIRGTPGFLVNGILVIGAQSFANFKLIIEKELAKYEDHADKEENGNADKTDEPDKNENGKISDQKQQQEPNPDRTIINIEAGDSPRKGDRNAPVTIIEFSDFQCTFCARFAKETLPKIEKQYVNTGKAKIIYKHLPLDIHPQANPAALASECAHEQGKFWQYHNTLLNNQNSLSNANYKKWAKQHNLKEEQFNDCLDNKKHQDKINNDAQQAAQADIKNAPTFLINGRVVTGAQPFSTFKQIIEKELDK